MHYGKQFCNVLLIGTHAFSSGISKGEFRRSENTHTVFVAESGKSIVPACFRFRAGRKARDFCLYEPRICLFFVAEQGGETFGIVAKTKYWNV